MHLLLTGTGGFIGRAFLHYLAESDAGHDEALAPLLVESVSSISRDGRSVAPSMTHAYTWEHLHDVPYIYTHYVHMAGIAHSVSHPTEREVAAYFQVNQGLTERLFFHFLASPVAECFIFLSSLHAVVDTHSASHAGEIITESTPSMPKGYYGVSKLAAEESIITLMQSADLGQKRVYILRPSVVVGKGAKGNVGRIVHWLRKGYPWPFGVFNAPMSVCSIELLLCTLHAALTGDIASGVYHVADKKLRSLEELIHHIIKIEGGICPFSHWHVPLWVFRVLAWWGSRLGLPFNQRVFDTLRYPLISSSERLYEALAHAGCKVCYQQK